MTEYDVVIVGASIAGCTAAIEYGRAGLRVALVDKHRKIDAYKALCGHFILGGARNTLLRLGVWDAMLAQGAATATVTAWSSDGWTIPPEPSPITPECISLTRRKLDPMLRRLARDTAGVDLMLGYAAVDLIRDESRISGVVVRNSEGATIALRGRLTVAADGHKSTVATLAGVRTRVTPNERFMFWSYYEGAQRAVKGSMQIWIDDPDVYVCAPTSDGLTMLGAFPSKERLPQFRDSRRAEAIEQAIAKMPDSPDLSKANRVSKVVGTTNYPCLQRDPVPAPGLALIGDAAIASDPVPATGCGWAFRSAAWLADATAGPLLQHGDVDDALRTYKRSHGFIRGHYRLLKTDAKAKGANPVQRMVRRAAVNDPEIARTMYQFGVQSISALELFNPFFLGKTIRASRG